MLSFINMGGRKKRSRKKSSRIGSGAAGIRGNRRVSRGSGSFMSPGGIGEIVERSAARPNTVADPTRRTGSANATGRKKGDANAPPSGGAARQRSPEIQLEFKHDSLLQTLPGEFLKYRNGSVSSIADDARRSLFSQTTDLDGSPREKGRRMAPLPTVTPIKIPASPLQAISAQQQQLRGTRIRRSIASNSPAWASDSEVSPVSGISAARDVLSNTFSFSAHSKDEFASASLGTGRDRQVGQRIARQDSATLPREFVWEGAVRSASVSRKSSAHSMRRRKLDVGAAVDSRALEAFVLLTPRMFEKSRGGDPSRDEEQQRLVPPRRDDSIGVVKDGPIAKSLGISPSPSPHCLTPSAQKLTSQDKAALHRVSKIVETDAEASASSPSLTPPVSGSDSGSGSAKAPPDPSSPWSKRKFQKCKAEPTVLGSPFNAPSGLSTPSTYSRYTGSPHASPSPGKRSAGGKSGAEDLDLDPDHGYESFLEDFEFVGPSSSGQSSRGGKSRYDASGSVDSPRNGYANVPMTAASMSTMSGSKSASTSGSSVFPQESPKFLMAQRTLVNANGRAKHGKQMSNSSLQTKGDSLTCVECDSPRGKIRDVVGAGKSPASSANSREFRLRVDAVEESPSRNSSNATNKITTSAPECTVIGKRLPPLPELQVVNLGLSTSPASTSASPLSCRSPDLLDILIPDGHIVTPISRRQIGRKRSGSTPSPITIAPQRNVRYFPMNGAGEGDDDDDGAVDALGVRNAEIVNTPSTGDTQTFPETPMLFSPAFLLGSASRSNSLISPTKSPLTISHALSGNIVPFQSIVIPTTPRVAQSRKEMEEPFVTGGCMGDENESSSLSTVISSTPPISPLQPPPASAFDTVPAVQILTDTARSSPPLLEPAPKRNTIRIRPPLPFGPRKPNTQVIKGTAPLSFGPRRAASESAAGLSRITGSARSQHLSKRPQTPLSSPTFNTTQVSWRALTLDAAKWTFSSTQLQGIIRMAIEESAQASAIRLLSEDVLAELLAESGKLEARRGDIQRDYKVLVRRRRSIIQRLTSLSAGDLRTDTLSVVRDAEELASVTAAGDKLAEELNCVLDQINQVTRLRDVHQASALAVALRKLNASLYRQTAENQVVRAELANAYAERSEAWGKAEELEGELDALQGAEQDREMSPSKSVSSSRRSSRVSLARKSSARTSKAGLRLSGYSFRRYSNRSSASSMLVHHATSERTTFSSDIVPPVPPLPNLDASALSGASVLSTSSRPPTSKTQPSAPPSTSDKLYHAVYDLLGVAGADRSMPSPSRPHSEVYYATLPQSVDQHTKTFKDNDYKFLPHPESATRLRSGSLPSSIPPQRDVGETDAILAVLDFRN